MRDFIVICVCATVLAAPQGYNYNQQQNGFSVVAPNFNSNAQVAATTNTHEGHGILQQAVSSGSLQQALSGGQNSAQNTQQFSTAPKFSQYSSTTQQNGGINELQQQAPLITNFEGQKQQQQQQLSGYQQHLQYQAPGTVTKDIYVHIAPEDQTQQYQQPTLPPPPPRKHYRIVFIKAPSQNSNNAALRIQQAPTEEKTIIYVLTKKSDALDFQAAIQDVQPKQPSKPEVYFIKYKTQEEAKHAQRTIQAQYDKLGGTSQVSDEGVAPVTSYIGSLDGSKQTSLSFSKGSGHSSSSSSSSTSPSSSSLISGGAGNKASNYLPPIVKL